MAKIRVLILIQCGWFFNIRYYYLLLKGNIPKHFDVFNSIILEMVTCSKSVGQEHSGAEAKHITKQLTIGPLILPSEWAQEPFWTVVKCFYLSFKWFSTIFKH